MGELKHSAGMQTAAFCIHTMVLPGRPGDSAYDHASCSSSHLILLNLTALPALEAAHQALVQPLAIADLQCSKRKVPAYHNSLQGSNKVASPPSPFRAGEQVPMLLPAANLC